MDRQKRRNLNAVKGNPPYDRTSDEKREQLFFYQGKRI